MDTQLDLCRLTCGPQQQPNNPIPSDKQLKMLSKRFLYREVRELKDMGFSGSDITLDARDVHKFFRTCNTMRILNALTKAIDENYRYLIEAKYTFDAAADAPMYSALI
eukprot:Opistho-1_new@107011